MIDDLVQLVDWIPDTIWDTVLIMLALYTLVTMAVWEVLLWLDKRERRNARP